MGHSHGMSQCVFNNGDEMTTGLSGKVLKINLILYGLFSLTSIIGVTYILGWKITGDFLYPPVYFFQAIFDLFVFVLLIRKVPAVRYLIALHMLASVVLWSLGQVVFPLMSLSTFFVFWKEIIEIANRMSPSIPLMVLYYGLVLLWDGLCLTNMILVLKMFRSREGFGI